MAFTIWRMMMKRLGLLLACTAILLVTACQSRSQTTFDVDPHFANVGMVVLDFQTFQFQRLYARKQTACDELHAPLSDDILLKKASGFFDAVGAYWTYQVVTDEHGRPQKVMGFEIKHVHDLAVLEIEPGDFGGFAIMHRCSGLLNFAGSIVWSGAGEQLFPATPLPAEKIGQGKRLSSHPESLDVLIGPGVQGVDETSGVHAWESVQDVTLVKQVAQHPYRVLVYLYPRSVGMFSPENALWVVVVYNIAPSRP